MWSFTTDHRIGWYVWSGTGDMDKVKWLFSPVCCFVCLCLQGLKAALSVAWCVPCRWWQGQSSSQSLPTHHVPAVLCCCFIFHFATQHPYSTLSLELSLQYWYYRFDLSICLNYFQFTLRFTGSYSSRGTGRGCIVYQNIEKIIWCSKKGLFSTAHYIRQHSCVKQKVVVDNSCAKQQNIKIQFHRKSIN